MTLMTLLAVCAGSWAEEGRGGDLGVVRNARSLREFRVVSQEVSADGAVATLTFAAPGGIFSFDVDLGGARVAKVNRLVFVAKATRTWEGITFRPRERGREASLKEAKGFAVAGKDGDCVMTFAGEALEMLRGGGRFQFIDAYR